MKKTAFLLSFTVLSVSIFAQNGNFKLDKDYSISKTGTLDLRSSDADVFITGSDRVTAHVKIERTVESKGVVWGDESFSVDIDEENGNLMIRERQENVRVGVIGYYRENYKIDIQVPLGVSLKIQGDDGDYFIKNVNGSIFMDTDDGDAELSGCAGPKFSFNIDDGDISMDGGQGELEIDGDDSDIKIRNGKFSSIDAEMDDGDIRIETSLVANGNYYIDSQDGSVVLDILGGGGIFDIRHDDARVVTEGNFKSIQKDEDRTKVSLAGGSAKINIRSDDGSVRLSAN
ncbi:MAG TPA: DUF4097 family beta strand repeat-containing protein [Cyclobacteriaceae bacterium]|nr:DUF4097 family beta strand repeat-containing protein [Cyclobacteriaceae bacterium]